MNPPEVDVIVVNWNTCDLLKRCLLAAENSEGVTVRLIVVDNGSVDGSLSMLRTEFPQVRVIANQTNAGFARANNQAILACSAPFILLLNSDAFVEPDTIAGMVGSLTRHADAGAVGCRLTYEDGGLQRSCYSFPDLFTEFIQGIFLDRLFPRSRLFGKYLMTWWDMADAREVDVVMGAVLLLRREALNQVGLLDESYFMYSEEVDLCYRLRRKGWKTRYEPGAKAVHLWGGSARKVPAQTMIRLYQSRMQFFRKHYGGLTAGIYKAMLLMFNAARGFLG